MNFQWVRVISPPKSFHLLLTLFALLKCDALHTASVKISPNSASSYVSGPSDESDMSNSATFITNINPALNPFFKSHCFMHITSFREKAFDFLNVPEHPLILRQIMSQKVIGQTSENRAPSNIEKLMWVASGLQQPERINKSVNKCFGSPYLEFDKVLLTYSTVCARLEFSKFPINIKPWTCEVYFGLFPPAFAMQSQYGTDNYLGYPGVWNYDRYVATRSNFPSRMPKFNVLFVNTKVHSLFIKDAYGNWLKRYFGKRLPGSRINLLAISTDRFFIFETVSISHAFKEAVEVISNIWSVSKCLNYEGNDDFQQLITRISQEEWDSYNFWFRVKAGAKKCQVRTAWDIYTKVEPVNDHNQNFQEHFSICNDHPLKSTSPVEFARKVITHVWRIIMDNYTHPVFKKDGHYWLKIMGSECSNGILRDTIFTPEYSRLQLEIEVKLRFPEYFIESVANDMHTLRFVSCGRPELSPLAFQEFLNVFQSQVWICVVVAILSLVLSKTLIVDWANKKTFINFLSSCLHYSQMLVEQSSSFIDLHKANSWRISLSSYLLVAIVISNAYRNVNVYNMVKPRVPIPYETFDQLITDRFTIFTRNAASVDFKGFPSGGLVNATWISSTPHEIYFSVGLRYLMSELRKLERSLSYIQRQLIVNEPLEKLRKYSQLHPHLLRIFNETGLNDLKNKNSRSASKLNQFWSLKFMEIEHSMLVKNLSTCQRVALIIPHHLAAKVARRMKYFDSLYVGKEGLVKSVVGFDLSGYTPPSIFKRMKAMNCAGIWKRWSTLLEDKGLSQRIRESEGIEKPERPNMSGNMLVMFALILSGQSLSMVAFGLECLINAGMF